VPTIATAGRLPRLLLREGRERSVLKGHPWIFSGAVLRVEGEAGSGDLVEVCAADGTRLAVAGYSPKSQIRARVWTREALDVDAAFLAAQVRGSAARRAALLEAEALQACRLVHGESDGIPGFVADRYGDVIVAQVSSAAAERVRETLFSALVEATGCACVYERSEAEVRALEGLPARAGLVRGESPPDRALIREHGRAYVVDVVSGQKTGFYLDQRDNRALVARHAEGRDVLNCFCYTGAFSIAALAAGARSACSIDSAGSALELARENAALNALDPTRMQWLEADVFTVLRTFRAEGRDFDLVVLDPPKLAPSAAHAERAARAYKDANLLALSLLRRGGLLFTFSCSGGVRGELFQKIVAGAASDARVDAQLLGRLQAAPDHPALLSFPEGEYLKGLMLKRI
jgi:23S rRNA (cytosine1962-C5)-methyltransferase